MGGISDKITAIIAAVQPIARPIALIGVFMIILSWVATPVLPEWAQTNKGLLVKVFLGAILIGLVPDIVNLVLPA